LIEIERTKFPPIFESGGELNGGGTLLYSIFVIMGEKLKELSPIPHLFLSKMGDDYPLHKKN
jgi:hypothetical protein